MDLKSFKKQLEDNEKRNRERKEAAKKSLEEKKKKEEANKQKAEIREKKLKEKEEQEKKDKEEKKKKLKEEEEKKKKIQQENMKKQDENQKALLNKFDEFRKKFGMEENELWSNKNWKDKKKYWEGLGLKEEDLRRKIQLKNFEQKKKEILLSRLQLRNEKSNTNSSPKSINDADIEKKENNQKQKKLIEDMCIIGDIMKNEIIENKDQKENYITIEEATKTNDKNSSEFVLGLLAQNLEKAGITTVIEKESKNGDDEIKYQESNTILQFMVNGLATKKKYELHFDINEERNEELLNNEEEQKKFIDKLRKKLAKEYNINEDLIIITNPQRGSFKLTIIFQSKDFNLTKEELIEKFNDEPELIQLKEIHQKLLLEACKISKDALDNRGNNTNGGWGHNETRGGKKYIPPDGWKGYGLKVMGKYDNGNDDWIAYDNREGEWCVAYKPIKIDQSINEAQLNISKIAKSNFKPEDNEKAADIDEEDYSKHLDINHPGPNNFVGTGVYCYQDPEIMEEFCGEINVGEETYKIGFMVRVNPKKIRMCAENMELWVLDGKEEEIRPYRILIKKIE